MLKYLSASNKLLLLSWFKFLLLFTNSLHNRITLLLVLKLLPSTKLIPHIHYFFTQKKEEPHIYIMFFFLIYIHVEIINPRYFYWKYLLSCKIFNYIFSSSIFFFFYILKSFRKLVIVFFISKIPLIQLTHPYF